MKCTYCGSSGYSFHRSINGHGELTYSCGICRTDRLAGDGFTKQFLAGAAIMGLIVLAILVVFA